MKAKIHKSFKSLLKNLLASAVLSAVIAVVGVIFSLIAHGRFTLLFAFNISFAIGALIIMSGLVTCYTPVRKKDLGDDYLADYDTKSARTIQIKEERRIKGFSNIQMGVCLILIMGFLQIILFQLAPSVAR